MNRPLVQFETTSSAVCVLTLDRPAKRNALSLALIEQIAASIKQAEKDPDHRVLVIRATGPCFCAGLDLTQAAQSGGAERSVPSLAEMYRTLCESPLVTIAAAQGSAAGGGAGLALACDFLLVSDDFNLAFPEVHRGLVGALVSAILRRQASDRTVRELLLLGQTVQAQRAVSLGLANEIVPAARLLDSAMQLAKQICHGAPSAIVRTKRLLDELTSRPIRDELNLALRYHLEARNSAEAAEGMQAFAQKRPPKWPRRAGPG